MMPAKRPAPKSAKGKKAISRPAVRKVVARKPEPPRARPAAVHVRKSAPPPKKPAALAPAVLAEPAPEVKRPVRHAPPPAASAVMSSSRAAPAVNTDGDDSETI